jgi:hypothetical protein
MLFAHCANRQAFWMDQGISCARDAFAKDGIFAVFIAGAASIAGSFTQAV